MRRPERLAAAGGEDGQMLVLLMGLVVLVFMVLALGWDSANWFLGHRALNNLADGAAVAAASEIDVAAYYQSEGRTTTVVAGRARATVAGYLRASAGDSGVRGVAATTVTVTSSPAGPTVTVQVAAPAQVLFLRWLGIVPPAMAARASATANLQ